MLDLSDCMSDLSDCMSEPMTSNHDNHACLDSGQPALLPGKRMETAFDGRAYLTVAPRWCREKLGWLVNSAAAVIFTIVLIVVLTRYHYNWQNYSYGPY